MKRPSSTWSASLKQADILMLSLVTLAFGSADAYGQASRPIDPVSTPGTSVVVDVYAPDATSVQIRGPWSADALPLRRLPTGDWTATAPVLAAGTYEYGVNTHIAAATADESEVRVLHVPAAHEAQFPAVPHGVVHVHTYASRVLGIDRQCWVYTPPGYAATNGRYPLLVLQHAGADTHKTWVAKGNVDWLLDELIAAGTARPMVVLMIDGHPRGETAYLKQATRLAAMDDLRSEILDDAIPLVEQNYRIEPAREFRALAGPSVGGGQAISIGLANFDRFAWLGSFSGGHAAPEYFEPVLRDAAAVNAKLKMFWISCAKDDKEFQHNQHFVDVLSADKINHEWHPTDGAHAWPVWRRDLALFLARLFKPA